VSRYPLVVSALSGNKENDSELESRMRALGVRETDIEEKFVRSSGHGGQNVNKNSTCVMLLHGPTGMQVKCQTTRQQGMNRFLARHLLLNKIEAKRKSIAAARQAAREKVRRQKRGRSRGAKERILADKKKHSDKKATRRQVDAD